MTSQPGHEYSDFPVCPHCGHTHQDWESWNDECIETECDHCEKPMAVVMHVSITFSTKPVHPTGAEE